MTPCQPAPLSATFHDVPSGPSDFLDALLSGLSRRRKAIPCKFLYDERGSALFERICDLPEYYPTRTEIGLLQAHGPDIARRLGPGRCLVDFGAGSSLKARLLLAALDRPAGYIPVDISREHLRRSADKIARDNPGLKVAAICADYTRPFGLPGTVPLVAGFFPGSTIGNFTPSQARRFLANAREVLAEGPLLVGVDLKKSPRILNAAYDDAAGVTAQFNLNLLVRANRELGADFRVGEFRHRAFYNARQGRVEMHLESRIDQRVTIAGRSFSISQGERIHTENSYKFTIGQFSALAHSAGFAPEQIWQDDARQFAMVLLMPRPRMFSRTSIPLHTQE